MLLLMFSFYDNVDRSQRSKHMFLDQQNEHRKKGLKGSSHTPSVITVKIH